MVKSIELTRGAEHKLMVPLKLFDLDCQRRALAENLSETQDSFSRLSKNLLHRVTTDWGTLLHIELPE